MTELSPTPPQELSDEMHHFLDEMRECIVGANEKIKSLELDQEEAEQEGANRSVNGSIFVLTSSDPILVPPAGVLLDTNFDGLSDEGTLQLTINLQIKIGSPGAPGAVLAFDVFVNGVLLGEMTVGAISTAYVVISNSFIPENSSSINVRLVQTTAEIVDVENTGKTTVTLLEFKE